MQDKNTAILLLHCPDREGLVATVTDFLMKNNGNIIGLEQYAEPMENQFFMRVEWSLENFSIPREKIGEFFDTLIAKKSGMEWNLKFGDSKPRVALFVSKYAHCFFDILARYDSNEWDIEIPLIISNHDKFETAAANYNIPYHHIPVTKANKQEAEQKQLALLKEFNVDLIVLARYMQILSPTLIEPYKDRIINIHHSSLPAFAGAKPYESAYQRGVKLIGATAHYVTEDLDAGPIIYQDVIRINHNDSIQDMKRKGRNTEKIVLANAVWSHLNHKIISYKNKTIVFS